MAADYPGTYVNGPTLGVPGALAGDPDTALGLNAASDQNTPGIHFPVRAGASSSKVRTSGAERRSFGSAQDYDPLEPHAAMAGTSFLDSVAPSAKSGSHSPNMGAASHPPSQLLHYEGPASWSAAATAS